MGQGALRESEAYIKKLGKKAFIVSGKHVTKSGMVKTLTDFLDEWGVDHVLFNDITGEPTDTMIDAGVAAYIESKCDFLIALGGGSPLDSAKAIAAMTVLKGNIADYMGTEIKGDFPPMVLIPTTAGTGSEATKFTIITDTENDVKMLLKGEALLPDLAVVDAQFTVSAPKSITASTGMDALTHAVESYISKRSNAITDMYALESIKRIFAYLPKAYADGRDIKARSEMAMASYGSGICINNASVTLVHGMSRPIGALFHVPHGISNAMLIKECMIYVKSGCVSKFAEIAKAIGAADADSSDSDAADAFLSQLEKLTETLEIPTLEGYGIDKDEFISYIDKMAGDAMKSGSPQNCISEVAKEDLIEIYARLWQ
jgi:alcohol dehydrogenase class IV